VDHRCRLSRLLQYGPLYWPQHIEMFKATAQDGLARCGLLVTKHSSIHTPATMLYTRRGGCLFLTPDLMEKLRPEAQVVQVNTMQL